MTKLRLAIVGAGPAGIYAADILLKAEKQFDVSIDLSPRAEDTGKLAGTDLRAGVATLPLLYLRAQSTTDAAAAALLVRLERGMSSEMNIPSDDADLTLAIAELRDHHVTARTLDEAHRWAREAVAALAPLPQGPVKKALTRFADTVVKRTS